MIKPNAPIIVDPLAGASRPSSASATSCTQLRKVLASYSTLFFYFITSETIVHEENGTEKIVHRCVSLRINGLKGAFISLGVLVVSILFCGCVQSTLNKRTRAYSYVD